MKIGNLEYIRFCIVIEQVSMLSVKHECFYLARNRNNLKESFFIKSNGDIVTIDRRNIIKIEEMTFLQKIKFKLKYIKYLFQ